GSAWTQLSTSPSNHYGGAAVLEPQMGAFAGSWRVLVAGGAQETPYDQLHLGTKVVERLDASPAQRAWQPVNPHEQLREARYYLNNVLLPDGGMVVVGGGSGTDPDTIGNYYLTDPARDELRQVELRRPGEQTWRLGAAQQEWRTYHSTASLLPDGRIFSAGDDYHEGPDPDQPVSDAERRDSAEIYWPPYLFNGDKCAPRPAIRAVGATAPPAAANAPWATLTYGEPFGIFSEHAKAGMQAALVAPSAVTHSFDMNQRVVPLLITSRVTGGGLNVRTPANASIAPPGWYMLFVIDADGTPSISRWVRLAPERGGAVPATVTGTWLSPKARSCINPDGTTISEPDPTLPSPTPTTPTPPGTKLTAKLAVSQASIQRSSRKLDVLAKISARASGEVKVGLLAGGRRTSYKVKIADGRIRVRRKISRSQAKPGTGIVTISYDGDDDTRAQSVRLRAARRAARLNMKRPTLTAGGRMKAEGTISKRARGVVRVELEFVLAGKTRTVRLRARIVKGRWKLSKQLTAAVRDQIAHRTGTLHSYTLFTGYERAGIRGEMRSFEVLGDP
ncbi:MAG: galactose oxidase early set domain-containing protein, partial [Actinomycetota bacterium]|nr:galactose oxidase early set domain-containing protein [Actinomycetota bacterium]